MGRLAGSSENSEAVLFARLAFKSIVEYQLSFNDHLLKRLFTILFV